MSDAYSGFVKSRARLSNMETRRAYEEREADKAEKMAYIGLAGKGLTAAASIRRNVVSDKFLGQKTEEGLQKFTMKTDGGFGAALKRAYLPTESDYELTSAGMKEMTPVDVEKFELDAIPGKKGMSVSTGSIKDTGVFKDKFLADKKKDFKLQTTDPDIPPVGREGRPFTTTNSEAVFRGAEKAHEAKNIVDVTSQARGYDAISKSGQRLSDKVFAAKGGVSIKENIVTKAFGGPEAPKALDELTSKVSLLGDKAGAITKSLGPAASALSIGSDIFKGTTAKTGAERDKALGDAAYTGAALAVNAIPGVGQIASLGMTIGKPLFNMWRDR